MALSLSFVYASLVKVREKGREKGQGGEKRHFCVPRIYSFIAFEAESLA